VLERVEVAVFGMELELAAYEILEEEVIITIIITCSHYYSSL